MHYALSVPNFAEPGALVELARRTEAGGWDGFFLWDHIVGEFGTGVPTSDPWTVLAAVATATSRVRIGTMVTPVPRRRPWVLARQVVTVDHLSGGRAVLGVGLGVPPATEYGAFGEATDQRLHGAMLDEALELLASLWSGKEVRHRGEHYSAEGVRFLPRPVQQPRVPVWSAAQLPATAGVRRGCRWDGVAPLYSEGSTFRPVTPEEVASIAAVAPSDRPFDIAVWAIAPDAELRRSYASAGATWLIEGPAPGPSWMEDALSIASAGPPPEPAAGSSQPP